MGNAAVNWVDVLIDLRDDQRTASEAYRKAVDALADLENHVTGLTAAVHGVGVSVRALAFIPVELKRRQLEQERRLAEIENKTAKTRAMVEESRRLRQENAGLTIRN